jgi:hypothetical protein
MCSTLALAIKSRPNQPVISGLSALSHSTEFCIALFSRYQAERSFRWEQPRSSQDQLKQIPASPSKPPLLSCNR